MTVEITQSELVSLADCPKKWDFKYNRLLRPKQKSVKLVLGSAIHEGIESFYTQRGDPVDVVRQYCQKVFDDADQRGLLIDDEYQITLQKSEAIMKAYLKRYKNDLDIYKVLEVEKTFRVHLVDDIYLNGKIDRRMQDRRSNVIYPTESKTAASWDEDVNRLMLDFQVSVYSWVESKLYDLDSVMFLYDVIRKPALRIKKNEDLEIFLNRIETSLLEEADTYFFRTKVSRSRNEINRTYDELVIRARDLVRRRQTGEVYRNPSDACFWKCDHRALCLEDTIDMEQALYVKMDVPHQELRETNERQD